MGGLVSIDTRFSDLKSGHFVRDAWCLKNPKERQYTWYNSDFSIASRLDSFLITQFLCDRVASCEIHPCVDSDHDLLLLDLDLHTTTKWGPGVWKFNNTLLQDEDFSASISDVMDYFLQSRSSFPSDMVM